MFFDGFMIGSVLAQLSKNLKLNCLNIIVTAFSQVNRADKSIGQNLNALLKRIIVVRSYLASASRIIYIMELLFAVIYDLCA